MRYLLIALALTAAVLPPSADARPSHRPTTTGDYNATTAVDWLINLRRAK